MTDSIIVGLIGIFVLALGWRIAFKGHAHLIAGWDQDALTNPRAFTTWFGAALLIQGACALATSACLYSDRDELGLWILAAGGVVLGTTTIALKIKYGK